MFLVFMLVDRWCVYSGWIGLCFYWWGMGEDGVWVEGGVGVGFGFSLFGWYDVSLLWVVELIGGEGFSVFCSGI